MYKRINLCPSSSHDLSNHATNCPNCGAPIEGVKCKYCGTYFFNIADIDFNKPKYIRIPVGNRMMILNVVASEMSLTTKSADEVFYANNKPFAYMSSPEYELDLKLKVVPDDEGIYMIRKDLDDAERTE